MNPAQADRAGGRRINGRSPASAGHPCNSSIGPFRSDDLIAYYLDGRCDVITPCVDGLNLRRQRE